ncbi:MAG: hypothetical protein WC652_03405 [archaeon]
MQAESQVASFDSVNCFDYYKFGAVNIQVQSPVPSFSNGTLATFNATLTNSLDYPLVDGAMYVKVYRKNPVWGAERGNDLIDQFYVKKQINLPAKGKVSFDFNYPILPNFVSGLYKMDSFFVESEKFNISGLSFFEDVTGGMVEFGVKSDNNQFLLFDKNSVFLNAERYAFIGFNKYLENAPVGVVASIMNLTDITQDVPVKWTVKYWDGLSEKVLETKEDVVSVKSSASEMVSYVVKDNSHSVYFVTAEASYKGAKTILDIRFAREQIEFPRINSLGVTKFPLVQGESVKVFSCAHNTTHGNVPDSKLTVSVLDSQNQVLQTYVYEGNISDQINGYAKEFVPTNSMDHFFLNATMEQNGKVVEEIIQEYNCEKISPSTCLLQKPVGFNWFNQYLGLVILALILLLIFGLYLRKKGLVKK